MGEDQNPNNQDQNQNTNNDQSNNDIFSAEVNYFDELVGDGKKYKDERDLAKAKYNADMFIEQLKKENAQVREELSKRLSAEEMLEKYNQSNANKNVNDGPQGQQTLGSGEVKSKEDLESIVANTLKKQKEEEIRSNNIKSVTEKLTEAYGQKTKDVLVQKAKELGMTVADLQSTASKSPKAFYNLIGLNNIDSGLNKNNIDIMSNSVNTSNESFTGNAASNTAQYFKNLYKSDKRKYFSSAVQKQIFEAVKQGRVNMEDIIKD